MTNHEVYKKIQEILFRHYTRRIKELEESKSKFVYYTTAETAFNIIKHKQLWMRNVLLMNDFSEFEYGRKCVQGAMDSKAGKNLSESLDSKFDGVCTSAYDIFKAWSPGIKVDTHVTCFSEYSDEDEYGLLSMWRAYGGKTGVAIVFKSSPFLSLFDSHKISTSPVAYLTEGEIAKELSEINDSVNSNIEFLSKLSNENFKNSLFNMFKYAALCNKHPSFKEEKEWRLLYSPRLEPSPNIVTTVEVVNGVPQHIAKLNLINTEVNLDLSVVLDKIIIGPCEFPHHTSASFYSLLTEHEIADVSNKIFITDIPLRHSI